MRANLKIKESKNLFQKEDLIRCLNRVMEVRIIELNLKKKQLLIEYSGPYVYKKISEELRRLGISVGEPQPLS